MKVEIWSDILCPFCYIGKRNFENALNQFDDKDNIEIIWKSYQLNPTMPDMPTETYLDYLVKHKGMSIEQVKGMLENVKQTAKQAGLDYNFEKAVMVNSLSAHKLIQFAKNKGLGDQAEEALFHAFFTAGKNIADYKTLTQLGLEIGLSKNQVENALNEKKYEALVEQDIFEAKQLGVQGVPFFVLNRKYAVSGAQPPEAFLKSLQKAYSEWRAENTSTKLDISEGNSCTPDGTCE